MRLQRSFRVNDYIPACRPDRLIGPQAFADAPFQEVSPKGLSQTLADSNPKTRTIQVVRTIEKLNKSPGLSPSGLVDSLIVFSLKDTDALGKTIVQGIWLRDQPLAPLVTTALQNEPARFCAHPAAESVGLGTSSIVWTKGRLHDSVDSTLHSLRICGPRPFSRP
jgi:hypothetical protein